MTADRDLLGFKRSLTMRKKLLLLSLLFVLLGATSPFGTLHACSDIHCEYRNACKNVGTAADHYESYICQSSCGYWYQAFTCCDLLYPNSHC
jgi:hypothetical protein